MLINYKEIDKSMIFDVIKLLNNECPSRPVSFNEFRNRILFDRHFKKEQFICAYHNETLVGCLFYYIQTVKCNWDQEFRKECFVPVFVVSKKYRRNGIGSQLLDFMELDGKTSILFYKNSPNYLYPGALNTKTNKLFFEIKGFEIGEIIYSMVLKIDKKRILENYESSKQKLSETNYIVKSFEIDDLLATMELLRENFSFSWWFEFVNAHNTGVAEKNILVVKDKERVIGYCQKGVDDRNNRFGPFGIHKDYRNEGLGGILFDYMAYKLMDENENRIFFLSTEKNGKRFYIRKDFEILEEYIEVYSKQRKV